MRTLSVLSVAIVAIIAIAIGFWQLSRATDGLTITHQWVNEIPVTVFAPVTTRPAPVVVIAHGFAGSQQLMQPFAITLARNGYVTVTFDLPGHGRNPSPLIGGIAEDDARSRALLNALDSVATFARSLPVSDGHLAVLGHSMSSDIVVRYAQAHPEVDATVAVSLFSRSVTATTPRNLLVIDGALEANMLKNEAYRVVGLVAGGAPTAQVTYGSFANGSARRLALSEGVEHIGVLYSRESMAEALHWMNQAFGRQSNGFVDARGPWLGLLFFGLIALAWPLSQLLPRLAPAKLGLGVGWRRLLPVAVIPALLTPLILWKLPAHFLPILLGDYLVLHFGVYGLLTAAGLWIIGRSRRSNSPGILSRGLFALAAVATTVYGILAIGLPMDGFITSFVPNAERALLILAMLAGTMPYFLADEWLTRGASAKRGTYAATKICFVLSLVLAILLNIDRLFFLFIIVPPILAFFLVYGLFSAWTYRRTYHPWVGAVANAMAFAWAIAVAFPVVGRL